MCKEAFIMSVQVHQEKGKALRCFSHQGTVDLIYAADTMNEQTKSIIINIPRSESHLKR